MREPLEKTVKAAAEHAAMLGRERQLRPGNCHPDDVRVAEEIVVHQFHLGFYRRALKAQIERQEASIRAAKVTIEEIEQIDRELQCEMDIAAHRGPQLSVNQRSTINHQLDLP